MEVPGRQEGFGLVRLREEGYVNSDITGGMILEECVYTFDPQRPTKDTKIRTSAAPVLKGRCPLLPPMILCPMKKK